MKKSIVIFIVISMVIGALVGCSKLTGKEASKFGDDYIKFETQEGGFSILLPEQPKHEVQSSVIGTVNMDLNMYYVTNDNGEYGVAYGDFPDTIMKSVNIDKLLDGLRDGMISTTKTKLLNEEKITIDKFQGKELKLEIEDGQKIAINRLFFAKNRMYMLSVEKLKGQETGDDVSTVLDSFKLISK